eukprot:TRINITY_DN10271_c0_g1_i1.p1 TRINITY_DN10271_c0_g1~~TRINITY_DN10271_c0_g1_i1.p1  ORF type:complete len:535 (-),score=82.43 TRINITY_DN10271_c0_g1_i1:77-1534(-)
MNVPISISEANLVFHVSENFTISTGDLCSKIRIRAIPVSQFKQQVSRTYSSLAIISETRTSKNYRLFIYNEQTPAVVVGQLLSDGYGFQISPDPANFTGLEICIPIPLEFVDWRLRSEMSFLDLAWSTLEFGEFAPLGLNLSSSDEWACFKLVNSEERAYFFVGLINDWQGEQIQYTWTSAELGLLITCNVLYVILLFLTVFALVLRTLVCVNDANGCTNEGLDFPKLALISLSVLATLRSVYFFGKPFGTFDDVELQVVFSDLPSLLYMISVVATGCLWAHLYTIAHKFVQPTEQPKHMRKLQLFFYMFCSSLCLIFVILQSIFGHLYSNQHNMVFTCATTQSEKDQISTAEIVSILYKAIFAFYCLIIATVFFYYGVHSLMTINKASISKRGSIVRKFTLVTILCTIGLLIQAAVLLVTTRLQLENTTKLALILASETIPSYCLLILFMPGQATTIVTTSWRTKGSRVQSQPSRGSRPSTRNN